VLIYGCDVGSRRLAVADPEQPHYEVFLLPLMRSRQRVDIAADLPILGEWISLTVPNNALIVLEKPFKGSVAGNIGTAVRLSMVAGAVISSHQGRCVLVNPSVWKKAVVGHGNAGADQIRGWVSDNHPAIAEACQEDQDLYCAACMGLYGRMLADGRVEAPGEVPELFGA
jgi:hypothetical protein